MNEPRPRRKSEILADENVRRIADQLRSERNDALSQAQSNAEAVAEAVALLGEARRLLPESDLARRIDRFLMDHEP
jgi:hypothetical protein